MTDIEIVSVDEGFVKILASPSTIRELSEKFTFDVPNAKFSPAYKARKWDGKIRLLDSRTGKIYAGLTNKIHEFARESSYSIVDNTDLCNTIEFSIHEAREFIKTLNLPYEVRDYQLRAFVQSVRQKRLVLISPTASGKSLIAYLIASYYRSKNLRTLIVVPNLALVLQLHKDFQDYGYDQNVQKIHGGKSKEITEDIVVSTWQSIYEETDQFLSKFDVIVGDEAHNFKAKSLVTLMTKLSRVKYRIGMTGTLDGSQVNELVLEGLFGSINKIVKTEELIAQKSLADLNIKFLVLKHTPTRIFESYFEEMEYLVSHHERNKFIRNLALSLNGNTLILFAYVEKHGKILHEMISKKKQEDLHFVSGEVDGEIRDDIRSLVEKSDNAIIVASYGVFSTGVNVKNIHNIIFASPTKSRTRTLQSIGRGLRLSQTKTKCMIFDIADDVTHRGKKNYTMNHMLERAQIYASEGFPYEIHSIQLKESANDTNNVLQDL